MVSFSFPLIASERYPNIILSCRVLQMAAQFPDAYIVGLDIGRSYVRSFFPVLMNPVAPIAPEEHPDNVSFEVHDINERTRFGDGTVDFVHARFCAMTVRSFR